MRRYALGGELGLTDSPSSPNGGLSIITRGRAGTWTLSGRTAIAASLQKLRDIGVSRALVPAYVCESVLSAVRAVGLRYEVYPVDADLTARPDPRPGDVVLLVHYFGWLNPSTAVLRQEARDFHLLEDSSHALLSDWGVVPPQVLVAASARKLAPVSFGGWCSSQSETMILGTEVHALYWRTLAGRLIRGSYLAADGAIDEEIERFYLATFKAAESFHDSHPAETTSPGAALGVLDATDWSDVSLKRRRNWKCLHEALAGRLDVIAPPLSDGVVPLNYVVRVRNRDCFRTRLAERRIFCPAYWPIPDAIHRTSFPEAVAAAESFLGLPIDQTCNESDMNFIAETVKALA